MPWRNDAARPGLRRILPAALLGLALVAAAVPSGRADTPGTIALSPGQSLVLARTLLAEGRADVAIAIAEALLREDPHNADALITAAAGHRRQGDHERARMLARRAHAAAGTDAERFAAAMLIGAADHATRAHTRAQFWLRRAGEAAATPAQRDLAQRSYGQVRRANPLKLRFAAAIAPVSNINDGTTAEEITLYGLPFRVAGAARALSGTEAALDFGMRYRLARDARSETHVTADLAGRFYRLSSAARARAPGARGRDYNYVRAELGLSHRRAAAGRGSIDVAASLGRSWRGGAPLSDFARLRLTRHLPLDDTTGVFLSFGIERHVSRRTARESATILSLRAGGARELTTGDRLDLGVTLRRTRADSARIRHDAVGARLGYALGTPLAGVRLSGALAIELRDYPDDPLLARARRDRRAMLELSAVFEEMEHYGFAPRFDLRADATRSTIALHARRSVGLRLGVESTF